MSKRQRKRRQAKADRPKVQGVQRKAVYAGDVLGVIYAEIGQLYREHQQLVAYHRAVSAVLSTGKYPGLVEEINAELEKAQE